MNLPDGSRVEQLKVQVQKYPKNILAWYGLAMSYIKIKELDEAVKAFDEVLRINKDYVAAYYHKGKSLSFAGNYKQALETYEHGLVVCKEKGDERTASEIDEAIRALPKVQ